MKRTICMILTLLRFLLSSIPVSAQEDAIPMPAGGKAGFKNYLYGQMIWPEPKEGQAGGSVVVACTVNADGKLAKTEISGMEDQAFRKEALRLVKGVVWIPARKKGKNIEGVNTLEVTFDFKKYLKQCRKRGWEQPSTDWDTSMMIYPPRQTEAYARPDLPPGQKFGDYMSRHLQTPEAARRQGISGRVILRFVIEPDGSISQIITDEHLGMGCTEEAIRVLSQLRWIPARAGGKAIRTWNTTTMYFGEGSHNYHMQSSFQSGSLM